MTYSVSHEEAQVEYVGGRRAAQWVNFFLSHLKPNFSVLDCGCGPGSITLDIAELVAPGLVIGIDVDDVSFEQGDAHALSFKENSFDAVLAHTILYHINGRLRTMREFHRVLKPGGVAGIADDDLRIAAFSPDLHCWHRLIDVWTQVVQHNGGNPFYSRHLRKLMLDAGFDKTAGFAVAAEQYGTLDQTRLYAKLVIDVMKSPRFVNLVTRQGWSSKAELSRIRRGLRAWGERPDAFYAVMYCAAIGWKRHKSPM
jgi:ubiquinone/menaquinone biosynthesis C-methylase UbiE